jgi:hypothetical protein
MTILAVQIAEQVSVEVRLWAQISDMPASNLALIIGCPNGGFSSIPQSL